MRQSALEVRPAGFCTKPRKDKQPKVRYGSSTDAAMALVEVRENYLRLGEQRPPIAWYPCDPCAGFHLTSHPRPVTAQQGPQPRKPAGP